MRRVLLVSVQTNRPVQHKAFWLYHLSSPKICLVVRSAASALVAFTKRVGPPHAGILHA